MTVHSNPRSMSAARALKRRTRRRIAAVMATLGLAAAAPVQYASAATYYWDNDPGAGFGTAGGTWSGLTANWNLDSTGNGAAGGATTGTGDSLNFGTGVAGGGLAAGTINISGTVSAGSITFGSQSGAIVLSGGTISLPASTINFTVNNSSDTITSALSGASTTLQTAGTGTLTLSGTGSTLARLDSLGGTLAVTGGSITMSSYFTTNTGGNYNQSGGTVQTNLGLYIANLSGSSTFTVSGGSVTQNNASEGIHLARGGGGSTATVNLSGSGALSGTYIQAAGGGTGIINLGGGAGTFSGGASIFDGGTSGVLTVGVVNMGAGTETLYFNGGTLRYNGNAAISGGGGYVIGQPGATLTNAYVSTSGGIIDNGGFSTIVNQILAHDPAVSGIDGGMNFKGAGTTTLSAASTYTGDTVVSAGTLTLTTALALQNSPLNYNNQGGTFSFGSLTSATLGGLKGAQNLAAGTVTNLTLNNQASTTSTYSGTLTAGSGVTLTKAGTGTQIFSGTGSTVGWLDVATGTLQVTGGTITTSSYFTTNTAGTTGSYLQTGGTVSTTSNGVYLANNGGSTNFTISGGSFTQAGTADRFWLGVRGSGTTTVTVSNSGSLVTNFVSLGNVDSTAISVLNIGDGTNFSGGTSILDGGTSGILTAGTINRANGTATLYFNGGTLQRNSNTPADNLIDQFSPITNAYITTGGGIIDNNSLSFTLNSNVLLQHDPALGGTADGGLLFKGSGTVTIAGNNTYTGPTVIHQGTVALASGGGFASSSIIDVGDTGSSGTVLDLTAKTTSFTFGSGQTLKGIGTVNIGAGKTVINSGILAPGNSIGTLTVTGNYTFATGSTYQVETDATAADRINISGAAIISGGAGITFSGTTGLGKYILATAASGLNSNNFSGSAPANYRLAYSSTELDLIHLATPGISIAVPSAGSRLMKNTTVTGGITGTVSNTAPANSDSLNVNLSATGNLGVSGYSGFTSPVAANGGSTNFTANFSTGNTLGNRSIQVTETDGALSAASSSFTVQVVDNRVVSATPITGLGNLLRNATVSGTTTLSSTTGDSTQYTNVTVAGHLFNGDGSTASPTVSHTFTTNGVTTQATVLTTIGEGLTGEAPINVGVNFVATTVGFATADDSGVIGVHGPALHATVANGGSYAGLASTVNAITNSQLAGSGSSLDTTATILAGTNGGSSHDVTMAWRTRTDTETNLLASDVVELVGVTGTFVLQMSYVDGANGGGESSYFLGWYNPTHNRWENAITGNDANLGSGFHLGAWNNTYVLGDFGIDTANNVAWAVLDHNSEFAVIPEPLALPGGLMLLSIIGVISRRRKQA